MRVHCDFPNKKSMNIVTFGFPLSKHTHPHAHIHTHTSFATLIDIKDDCCTEMFIGKMEIQKHDGPTLRTNLLTWLGAKDTCLKMPTAS